MKKKNPITLTLGILLFLTGCFFIINKFYLGAVILILFGASLFLVGLSKNRTTVLVFGHACIVVGCMLVTWVIYLIPHSKPDLLHIFARPLFWGLFSIFGGICANYHGFCKCIVNKT